MFSTRSPTLTPRSATTPSIGERITLLARCVSRALDLRPRRGHRRLRRLDGGLRIVERLRGDEAVLLELLRPLVLALRAVQRHPRLRLGGLQRLDARLGLARVEPREPGAALHRHPLGDVDVGHDAGHLRLHVGGELRLQRSDDVHALLEVGLDHRVHGHGHRRRPALDRLRVRLLGARGGCRDHDSQRCHSGPTCDACHCPCSPCCRCSPSAPSKTSPKTRFMVSRPSGGTS